MNRSLFTLLFTRYKRILLGLIVFILGFYAYFSFNDISSWHQNSRYLNSEQGLLDFNKSIEESYEFDDEQQGKVFLYYDLSKEKTVYTNEFSDYRENLLTVFNSKNKSTQLPYNAYEHYNEHFFLFFIMLSLTGFFLALFDLHSHFNSFLFSSKFKRSNIYWNKLLLIGGSLFTALFIAKSASILAFRLLIPNHFLNISLGQHILSSMTGLLAILTSFTLSYFLGMLIGEWVSGIILLTSVYFTFKLFLQNISFTISYFEPLEESPIILGNSFDRITPVLQTSIEKVSALEWAIMIVLVIITCFAGSKVFSQLSLENSNRFLLLPKIETPFQLLLNIYLFIVFNINNTLLLLAPEEPLTFSENFQLITKIVFIMSVCFLATNLLIRKKVPFFSSARSS